MIRVSVDSTNLHSVGYNPDSQTLEVKFHSGSVYQYFDVPYPIYEGLMNAASKGKFFNSKIRTTYRYKKA